MVEQKNIKKNPLGDSRKMMFNHHPHHWLFPTYFPTFLSHSLHFLPKNTPWE